MSHEAKEAEDDKASQEAGETVGEGHEDGITEGIVVELVIGGECYQTSPAWSKGEKYLHCCISPNLSKQRKNFKYFHFISGYTTVHRWFR